MISGSFKEKVFREVTLIPKGKVLSYKGVAELVGSPRAYRAVGTVLSTNNDPNVPCHRVVNSDGAVGYYNGINGKKEGLLRTEGVEFNPNNKVNKDSFVS